MHTLRGVHYAHMTTHADADHMMLFVYYFYLIKISNAVQLAILAISGLLTKSGLGRFRLLLWYDHSEHI